MLNNLTIEVASISTITTYLCEYLGSVILNNTIIHYNVLDKARNSWCPEFWKYAKCQDKRQDFGIFHQMSGIVRMFGFV